MMAKDMPNWAAYKNKSITAMDVLMDMKRDIDAAISYCNESDKENLIDVMSDLYCDCTYFLRDFNVSQADIQERMNP